MKIDNFQSWVLFKWLADVGCRNKQRFEGYCCKSGLCKHLSVIQSMWHLFSPFIKHLNKLKNFNYLNSCQKNWYVGRKSWILNHSTCLENQYVSRKSWNLNHSACPEDQYVGRKSWNFNHSACPENQYVGRKCSEPQCMPWEPICNQEMFWTNVEGNVLNHC